MRVNDLALGMLMVLVGVITAWASRDFPSLPRQNVGAGTFPTIIGVMLVVLGGFMMLRGWSQRRGPWFVWQGNVAISRALLCLMVITASVVGYVLLTPILGFPTVSMVMISLLVGWLTEGRWLLAVLVALIATLVVWLTFAVLLHVPLALGFLEEVVY